MIKAELTQKDDLTGLYSRRGLLERFGETLAEAKVSIP